MDKLIVSGLPLNAECKLKVHHCCEKKWNEEIRFSPFPIGIQNNAEIVIYLGGNTHAGDAQRLKTLLPNLKKMHILEPVPEFFTLLQSNMAAFPWVSLHQIGLGAVSRNVTLSVSELNGQSTFNGY